MNRGYEEQQLDFRLNHLSSHLAIFGNNHQTTSKYPSYIGATTKGFSFTTVNRLSLSKKFEGSLGQSRINIKHTQGTGELVL